VGVYLKFAHCVVVGMSMCSGFGFIQFERAGDARRAVLGEQGSYMNGLMLGMFACRRPFLLFFIVVAFDLI